MKRSLFIVLLGALSCSAMENQIIVQQDNLEAIENLAQDSDVARAEAIAKAYSAKKACDKYNYAEAKALALEVWLSCADELSSAKAALVLAKITGDEAALNYWDYGHPNFFDSYAYEKALKIEASYLKVAARQDLDPKIKELAEQALQANIENSDIF